MFTTFWQTLTSSIYNPDFYARVLRGERMHTKSFVFIFSCIAALVASLFVAVGAQWMRAAVAGLPAYVQQAYPDTMVLTISQQGVLSVAGVEEPVYIPAPDAWATGRGAGMAEPVQYAAVVDTQTPYNAAEHKARNAFFWLGATSAWAGYAGMGGGTPGEIARDMESEQTYAELVADAKEPVVITKTDADLAARAIARYAGYIVPSAVLVTFIVTLVVYAWGMVIFGLLIGLLILLLVRILPEQGKKFGAVSYRAAVRAAIFAGVLPSIVMMVSWFTPVGITYGLYTLATLMVVYVNMRGVTKE